jgi:uncharacterized delta-60 repeat protein
MISPFVRLLTRWAVALLFGGLAALAPQAQAQGGVPLWTNRYDGPSHALDEARAVAVDSSGNVFVTGYSVSFGSDDDYVTIKYSSAGLPLWTNRYSKSGNSVDQAFAIAVDSSGNAIVTGYSFFAGDTFNDYVTIKYSGAGVPLWTNRYDGPGSASDTAYAIAVDSSDNIFVAGRSTGSNGYLDYATIKYSGAGVSLWTNRYNGPGNTDDEAHALAVDSIGNVIVTGASQNTGGVLGSDFATIKYSGAGMPLWTNRYNGTGNSVDVAKAVAVDSSGNVFVIGSSTGTNGFYDYATIKYSAAGIPLWTNRYNGPANQDDLTFAVAVDSSGDVSVTGNATSTAGGYVYATIKYSGAGVPLWTNRNGSGITDSKATALAVDSGGNVFVTGSPETIAYSSAGVPLWTNAFFFYAGARGGPAMALDSNGSVFVTGQSDGDFATIKYSSSVPPAIHLGIERDGGGGYFIRITSASNATYRLQRAPSVTGPWDTLGTLTSPASGYGEYHDTVPLSGPGFYRTVQP